MIESFLKWLNIHGYTSYDQYDFWSIPYGKFAKRIYYKNRFLGISLVAPLILLDFLIPGLRALIVQKKRFPIADAHFVMGYINLFEITKDKRFLEEAIKISDELLKLSISGYSGHCWGYPFDWQTSYGLWKKGTPLITTTPYCFEAFLKLYDITKEGKYLDIAYSTAQFALKDLNRTLISENSVACSYTPVDYSTVINANTYRAFLLMEAHYRFGDKEFKKEAIRNINFVLENQQPDGSWLYAVNNPYSAFIDNFHTCFVLKNLYKANLYLKDKKIKASVRKGYTFYRKNLLTDDDVPKPYAVLGRIQLVKIESYDYAEGISLAVLLKDEIPSAFELAKRLAQDVYIYYQLPDGHFTTRLNWGGLQNNLPYLRWPQAQMFYALTMLYKSVKKEKCVG